MSAAESPSPALSRALDLLATGSDEAEVLRAALGLVVSELGYDRAALIAAIESSALGYVLAATDDPSMSDFCLEVGSYPEIAAAFASGQPVFIADTEVDALTEPVRANLRAAQVRAIAVFPIVQRQRPLGVVLVRRSTPAAAPSPAAVLLGQVVAAQLGLSLRDSHVMERLREETRRISRASYEAERRLRTIESLREHFEAVSDGVFVVDEDCHLLFVNGAAESITGFARERLVGSVLLDLVSADQRLPLDQVVAGVLGGTNIDAFDLDLYTTSGNPITVSVATSTVLAGSGAAILSFRDVTAERVLENELSQTKDFLEKLIDSAVDAIIAADLSGNLILFNPGAERLTGWKAEEVVGVLGVAELYPDGVARQVMRMLRSTSAGGVGRLEQVRRELKTKSGELVPVNMTASIIYDQGREVATVGIFSDLRERIRIEQRLLQAQERLEAQERDALVAQLAGAAAHELNQPLTSILAYAELIARQTEPDAAHRRGLEVIRDEAARMAEIVKKIGRITNFETKEYVGSASIVDLDRSTAPRPAPAPAEPFEPPAQQLDEVEEEPTSRIDFAELAARTARRTSPPDVADAADADRGAVPDPVPVGGAADTKVGHHSGRPRRS